jgi:hypothetical protein
MSDDISLMVRFADFFIFFFAGYLWLLLPINYQLSLQSRWPQVTRGGKLKARKGVNVPWWKQWNSHRSQN